MLERLSADARRALVAAHEAARAAGAERIGLCHLVYGLLVACGDEQSTRLQAAGLAADAVREHIAPLTSDSVPAPLSAAEARDLTAQLRERGMTAEEAREIVDRVQEQRALGPVALDDAAREVLTATISAGGEAIETRDLLTALMDSPHPEVAALFVAVGVTPADIRSALV